MDERLDAIYDSHVNGQGKQLVEQINKYGEYNLWNDMRDYLRGIWVMNNTSDAIVLEMVIKYHRMK